MKLFNGLSKKLIGSIIIICIIFSVLQVPIYANEIKTNNIDRCTMDDGYSVEMEKDNKQVITRLYDPQGNLIDTTIVDRKSKNVKIYKNNKLVKNSNIDDYVKKIDANSDTDSKKTQKDNNNELNINSLSELTGFTSQGLRSPQKLKSEPVTDYGLSDSVWGDGYKSLGNLKVNYCKEPGYLFRKIKSGYPKKREGYKFTFTKGTAVSTVVGVMASAFVGGPITAAVVIGLMATGSGVLVDYFDGKVSYRTYYYQYRVRVKGNVKFSTSRIKDYWVSYNDYRNKWRFKYKSFRGGFSQSNFELTKAGIDRYCRGL